MVREQVMSQGLPLSVLRIQEPQGLTCAQGHQVVNHFRLSHLQMSKQHAKTIKKINKKTCQSHVYPRGDLLLVPLGIGKGHQSPGELVLLNTGLLQVHSITQLKESLALAIRCCWLC